MENTENMLVVLGILGWFSIQDIKKKSVSMWQMILAFVVGAVIAVTNKAGGWNTFAGILLGLAAYIAACISKEQIGKGDAVMLMVTGVFLGGRGNLELLFIGLLLAAVYAAWLLIARHTGRRQSFAFIPFMAAAQLIRILLYWAGGIA